MQHTSYGSLVGFQISVQIDYASLSLTGNICTGYPLLVDFSVSDEIREIVRKTIQSIGKDIMENENTDIKHYAQEIAEGCSQINILIAEAINRGKAKFSLYDKQLGPQQRSVMEAVHFCVDCCDSVTRYNTSLYDMPVESEYLH